MEIEDDKDDAAKELIEEVADNSELIADLAHRLAHGDPESTVLMLAFAFASACAHSGMSPDEYYELIEGIEQDILKELSKETPIN